MTRPLSELGPNQRLRQVTLLDLRPDQDVFDPALESSIKTPTIGFTFAFLSSLAAELDFSALTTRGREYRSAIERGETPPASAVNTEDWWDIARWVLEHRLTRRLEAEGAAPFEARRRASLGVSQMLAPIRELLR